MSNPTITKIAIVGESLIEFIAGDAQQFTLCYGGDAANVAVYLARYAPQLALQVEFVSAIGDDAFSDQLLAFWQAERVGTQFIARIAQAKVGLHIANGVSDTTPAMYYRENTAAAQFFQTPQHLDAVKQLSHYDYLYLTGTSIALLSPLDRDVLLTMLHDAHHQRATIVFAPDCRADLWENVQQARENIQRFFVHADIVLTSFDTESSRYPALRSQDTAKRVHDWGVEEVVVRNAAGNYTVSINGQATDIAVPTTVGNGCSDAFNAGYLAARTRQLSPSAAVLYGNKLAAACCRQYGTLIPKTAMPELFMSTVSQ